jgi:phosphate starvation-inducible PhoH-like protein
MRELCGERRANLKAIERRLGVGVASRGNTLWITGEPSRRILAADLVRGLIELTEAGFILTREEVHRTAGLYLRGDRPNLRELFEDTILVTARKRPITPRSPNQKRYVDAIRTHDIVFGIGPAGTGKTYLAVAMAIAALQAGDVRRIILCRPAVEAGEKLGFLPGDLAEKVDPYLRPLYDALHDMLAPGKCARLMEQGTIEIAPLAFMRGRTLDNAFIILDEAQNTTPAQMKMFLTRLGTHSRAVINGDVTQVDLPGSQASGLRTVRGILAGVREIPFIDLTHADVLRHPLVQRIVEAYENHAAERADSRGGFDGR